MRFLQSDIAIMEAQLAHRRDDLTSVTNRIAELLLAPETDGEPSALRVPPTPESARSTRSQAGTPPDRGREVPDYNNDNPWSVGDRVLIMVRGEYKGRKATVIKILGNGKHMVKVEVDPIPPSTTTTTVNKALSSLQRLKPAH